jgi:hypothetical protein
MYIHLIYITSIIFAVVTTFVLTRRCSLRQLLRQNEVLKKTNKNLRNENTEYEERTKRLLEQYIRPMRNMREDMKTLAQIESPIEQVEALRQLFETNCVWPNGKNKEFVEIIFRPLTHELKSIDLTNQYMKKLHLLIDEFYDKVNSLEVRNLNDWDKAQIRTNLLRLSFQLMDGCQSINYFNHVKMEQGINSKLINKECSPVEAEAMCKSINDLEAETPRWARVLKFALSPWLTTDEVSGINNSSSIILRGYLFNKKV